MRATLDSLCYEMEKSTTTVSGQIKCIDQLGNILKSEKDPQIFQRALDCVANAISNNDADMNVIVHSIQMYDILIDSQKVWPILENSDIVKQFITIASYSKDDAQVSEMALNSMEKLIRIPTIRDQFNDILLVKTLVAVSRLNTKSESHANHVITITMFLDPELGPSLKKLCNVLIIYSQNFQDIEDLQARLLLSFLNIATTQILEQISSTALPHFVQISDLYPNDFPIFRSVVILAGRCPAEYCPKSLIDSILFHKDNLVRNRDVLSGAISILATKFKSEDIPIDAITISYFAMMNLITNQKAVKQALTVCYHSLTKSKGQFPPDIDLLSAISSIIMLHSDNPSIIRRSSVVIHSLISHLDELALNSIPLSLLASAENLKDDSETVSIVMMSLSSFVGERPIFGLQLHSNDNIETIHSIISKNEDEMVIISHCLTVLRSIVLSKYEYEIFLGLPIEKKSLYLVDSSICGKVLKENIDDIIAVKSALLLMEPDTDSNSKIIAKVMNKYSSDPEVMISGISQNVEDLDAITATVLLCKEDSLRYALPFLEKTKEKLPTQLIEYLLSLDREDVVEVLLLHLERKSCDLIGNQFQLSYSSQISLAFDLYQKNLYEPQESDYPLFIQTMYDSMFNPKQLSSSLFFIKLFGIDDKSFPFLIKAIKQNPTKSDIVEICAQFICAFQPSDEICQVASEVNAVSIVANAMLMNKKNQETIESCMTLMHFFSYYEQLDDSFVQTLALTTIAEMASIYSSCIQTMCSIFCNLIKNVNIAENLMNLKISKIVFKKFGKHAYQLIYELLEQCDLEITSEQFDIIIKELDSKEEPTANESFNLLRIIQICFQKNIKPKRQMKYTSLISFLHSYPNESLIVQCAAELLLETKKYEDDNDLLFALLEALRANQDNKDVVSSIIILLPKFASQKNTLNSSGTVELMLNLINIYKTDVLISSYAFEILKGHPESYSQAVSSLATLKDKKAILVISQNIVSYINEIDPSDCLGKVLRTIKLYNDDCDICSYLTQVVFFCSTSDNNYETLVKFINRLSTTCVKHIRNVNVCRATVGVICNVSMTSHYIPQLIQTPQCVIMALKSHPSDVQIITASFRIISNFALADKGQFFIDAIPILILALKNRLTVETTCQAIIDMDNLVYDYSSAISEELINLIKKEKDKSVPTRCLLVISTNEGTQDAVFGKLSVFFEMISNNVDEDLSVMMLGILSNLKDSQRLKSFEQFLPKLITMVKETKGKLALPAANCCLNLARNKPEMILQFVDTFALISETSKGEVGRTCALIKDELYNSK